MRSLSTYALLLCASAASLAAQTTAPDHKAILALVNKHSEQYQKVSKQIWDFAELGYHEQKSSALLEDQLRAAGFTVTNPMPDEPTAFVATYGSGSPVIGILGEFDALPGLSQASVPDKSPVVDGAPGHGCGHNLLGSAAALAATSLKEYMAANHIKGTLRYYGTPAEEGGSGKVYMVRARPLEGCRRRPPLAPRRPQRRHQRWRACRHVRQVHLPRRRCPRGHGPGRGCPVLDGVMLDGQRHRVPARARPADHPHPLHNYQGRSRGNSNVVPDLAQMYLMARSPSGDSLSDIWDRVLKNAHGAAMMTDTTVDINIVSAGRQHRPQHPAREPRPEGT